MYITCILSEIVEERISDIIILYLSHDDFIIRIIFFIFVLLTMCETFHKASGLM